jgi:hypothetical protein
LAFLPLSDVRAFLAFFLASGQPVTAIGVRWWLVDFTLDKHRPTTLPHPGAARQPPAVEGQQAVRRDVAVAV